MIQIIILIFKIFSMRKSSEVYIFERSIYDVIIDPSRYRLSHNPILIKIIYNIFFRNAKKIYIDASYKIIKKRKDELSKKKYLYLTNKLNKYYKKEVHGL
tara:strand:- start:774 stop:1073 length:300 start_codon:yes stop_codon:yes gene_type:complete